MIKWSMIFQRTQGEQRLDRPHQQDQEVPRRVEHAVVQDPEAAEDAAAGKQRGQWVNWDEWEIKTRKW